MTKFSKKQTIFIIFFLFIFGVVFYYLVYRQSQPTVEYKEVSVERGSIQTSILSTGVVKPENRVEVKPPIAGRAEKVMVEEGARVKKGQRLVLMSSTERAALLDAARARGFEELKKWEELYRPTPILAPVSGTVIQRQIEEGQTFSINDPILVMSDRLIVEANVDETDLAKVQNGQRAQITLDAYPEFPISAHVESIAYEATTINNVTTYVVKLAPDSVPTFMRSGMTSNVRFEIQGRESSLLVPAEALTVEEGETRVTLRSDGEVRSLVVKVGLSDGKRAEIEADLQEGDKVLIPNETSASVRKTSGKNPFSPLRPGSSRGGSRPSSR